MRLKKLALMGLTAYPGTVSLDLEELGPGLISISGPNGAGKTTLLEAPAAALFRALPSRPRSLYEYAHGRDAFVEATFTDGAHDYQARVLIDAEGRKSEGYLTVDGEPVTSGKARDFDAAIAARFGTPALFMASVFAAQNRAGDFLAAPRSQRKALFAELLGLGRLTELAEAAKARREAARDRAAGLRGRVETLAEKATGEGELELDVARGRAEDAAAQLRAAEEAERAALAAWDTAERAYRDHQKSREALDAQRGDLQLRLNAIASRQDEAARAPESARERVRRLQAQPDTIPAERARADERLERDMERLKREADRLDAILADEDEIHEDWRMLAEVQQQLHEALAHEEQLAKAERKRDREAAAVEAHEAAAGDIESRAACYPKDPALFSACSLVAGAEEINQKLEDARERLERAQEVVNEVRLAQSKLSSSELREEERRLQGATARATALTEAKKARPAIEEEIEEAKRQHTLTLAGLEERLESLEKQMHAALDDVRTADAAFARVSAANELEEEQLSDDLARVNAQLAEIGDGPPDPNAGGAPLRQALEEAREMVQRKQRLRDHDIGEVARLEAVVAQKKADREALAAARLKLAVAENEIGEWIVLADALGPKGVQALEIDAAGPGVADRANALLDACYGPRFSLGFETLREKRSAKGEYTEVFDIHVYDGGVLRDAGDLSGGEKVIVGEALALALAIYNAQQSDIRWRTLWRDETAGALDPSNAQAYVDMLRRAMEVGGFEQVIYVSHVPEVWARADVSLRVEGGEIRR